MAFLSLIARLGLDSTGFQLGVKQAESSATKLKTAIGRAFGTAAVIAFARSVVAAGDRIGDLAEQSGITAKSVQELDYVLGRFGTNFEGIQGFIEKLRQARDEALSGSREMRTAFESIGISAEKLASTDGADALLRLVGGGLSGMGPEDQGRVLRQIGGIKAGPKLRAALQAFGGGGESDVWRRMVPEAQNLTSILSDSGSLFWKSIKAAAANIMAATDKYAMFGVPSGLLSMALGRGGASGATGAAGGNRLPPVAGPNQLKYAEELFKAQMESLPVEQRKAEMQKRINQLTIEASALESKKLHEEGAAKRLEALRLFSEMLQIGDDAAGPGKPHVAGGAADVNALQRIGAQVGVEQKTETLLRQQLSAQEAIKRATMQTADNTRDAGGGIP